MPLFYLCERGRGPERYDIIFVMPFDNVYVLSTHDHIMEVISIMSRCMAGMQCETGEGDVFDDRMPLS